MTPPRLLALGLLLTAVAGFVDGVAFAELGGVFVSFMSGNTTQLGTAFGAELGTIALLAGLVLSFFAGSAAGTALFLRSSPRGSNRVLALTAALVALALGLRLAGIPASHALWLLAIAMGAQNAAVLPAGAVRLGATFVTGTLFAAGQDFARALLGAAPRWRFAQHLAVWLALLIGAIAGGLLHHAFGVIALAAPLLVYAGLAFALRPQAVVRPR